MMKNLSVASIMLSPDGSQVRFVSFSGQQFYSDVKDICISRVRPTKIELKIKHANKRIVGLSVDCSESMPKLYFDP
jgi:hypothetical protein